MRKKTIVKTTYQSDEDSDNSQARNDFEKRPEPRRILCRARVPISDFVFVFIHEFIPANKEDCKTTKNKRNQRLAEIYGKRKTSVNNEPGDKEKHDGDFEETSVIADENCELQEGHDEVEDQVFVSFFDILVILKSSVVFIGINIRGILEFPLKNSYLP